MGVQLGRALGLVTQDLEAVFYGALIKDVGCGACGVVLAPFFVEEEQAPRLDLSLVDLHSPRNMAAWAGSQLRLDPSLPARLARLASFAAQCVSVTHEAAAAHCEIAADFAGRLGFDPHVQDAVRYQYERHDGRGLAFQRRAKASRTLAAKTASTRPAPMRSGRALSPAAPIIVGTPMPLQPARSSARAS
jgi:hypothetical protein